MEAEIREGVCNNSPAKWTRPGNGGASNVLTDTHSLLLHNAAMSGRAWRVCCEALGVSISSNERLWKTEVAIYSVPGVLDGGEPAFANEELLRKVSVFQWELCRLKWRRVSTWFSRSLKTGVFRTHRVFLVS